MMLSVAISLTLSICAYQINRGYRLAVSAGKTPLIRAGSGGGVLADALFCAEEAAGGSRSSSATAGGRGGADDLELDSVRACII